MNTSAETNTPHVRAEVLTQYFKWNKTRNASNNHNHVWTVASSKKNWTVWFDAIGFFWSRNQVFPSSLTMTVERCTSAVVILIMNHNIISCPIKSHQVKRIKSKIKEVYKLNISTYHISWYHQVKMYQMIQMIWHWTIKYFFILYIIICYVWFERFVICMECSKQYVYSMQYAV